MADEFPRRALIQQHGDGRLPPESQLVVDEMKRRGIPFELYTTDEIVARPLPLSRDDLVVGDFEWTRRALQQLGVAMPEPPDYPDCLQHLLHRKVWPSTLGDVMRHLRATPGSRVFIKPATDTKAFSGLVASVDEWMDYLLDMFPPSFAVWCSELVDIAAEFRVYCVDGQIRQVCRYIGPQDAQLDMAVVNAAVHTLFQSPEGRPLTGCGIDFALLRQPDAQLVTALVEVNDGYSLGAYQGLSAKDYTDMCVARWKTLVKKE